MNILNASWVDVNTNFTLNKLPDQLVDYDAILKCSLFNLFNCVPGQRGRIFEPTYGSSWMHFLQEPISEMTARKIRILMLNDIKKWEPRVAVDSGSTYILPDMTVPGYKVRLALILPNLDSVLPALDFEIHI